MSAIERNKGKLTLVEDNPCLDFADWESLKDLGMVRVNGRVYKVQWEVEGEEDCEYFADIKTNIDGSIDFHTLHNNGAADWTDLVEEGIGNGYS